MTAVITFGRSASGVRIVITPISGALTSGLKNDDVASAAITTGHRQLDREREDRERERDERRRAEPQRIEAPDDAHGDDAAEHGTRPERGEERARHPRAAVLLVGEHRQTGAQHLAEAVRDERGTAEHPQQLVAEQEANPGKHPARLLARRQAAVAAARTARAAGTRQRNVAAST